MNKSLENNVSLTIEAANKIGFVGLGEMGLSMALNLKKAGFQVYAFDVNQSIYEKVQQQGIVCCNSIKEVAENSDNAVISMVRTAAQTESVIFGEEGIVSADKQGLTIVVMSTLDPSTMKELEERVEEAGYYLVDAPVSGGPSGSKAGTLSIMTAGKEEAVQKCMPYFQAMGKNLFNFGVEAGMAQVAKLANNLVLGINIIGVTEALRFGRKNGLPANEIIKLMKVSTGGSWVVDNWGEVEKWKPDATLGAINKDLTAVKKAASKNHLSLPFGELALQLLAESMEAVNRDLDM
ncbi:NAD(P)-dependent oxidoreductase [Cytobacillus depressus]|uniref:NAD(P)-dependent oxidoreductase n=1 Tax=Cytobacillus depressus TaxID=1602942 RepID=A0A6L3UYS0_9BACI|nr:NAD(P)-dependent oxidoreductase [Cytobacillus depressus]KAB2329406.1 NAD(P)-dependent oxidoreductase [Cytobacillus depressus]